MKQDIKKLLGLQNVWVDSWEIKDREIVVRIRSPRTNCMCPHCTSSTKRVHQYKSRKILHSIWQSRQVILHLKFRRFYCNHCQKAFTEYIHDFDKRRTTENFRKLILKDLARNSLSYVNKITNISPPVLYSVLKENQEKFKEINWEEQGEKFVLGIDEHSYRGRNLVLTATNITKKKLLMVGRDDRLKTLSEFLKKADKKRIFEVCIDMKRGYLNTIKKELPGAKITVDKFHVIAYANKNMDAVRSILVAKQGYHVRRILLKGKEKLNDREKIKLENLFKKFEKFSSLYQSYFIKEKLRDFYRLKNKSEARKKLDNIIMFCENSQSSYMRSFGKTLFRWKENILNYFDNYSTNAFTEGVHTKIKMIKRISFGFRNIDNYIAKVTLAFIPFFILIQHTIC
jgi:transposase